MTAVKSFFGNISKEFRKIVWPTEKEMKEYSVQVGVFVLVLTVYFFVVDTIISQVVSLLG